MLQNPKITIFHPSQQAKTQKKGAFQHQSSLNQQHQSLPALNQRSPTPKRPKIHPSTNSKKATPYAISYLSFFFINYNYCPVKTGWKPNKLLAQGRAQRHLGLYGCTRKTPWKGKSIHPAYRLLPLQGVGYLIHTYPGCRYALPWARSSKPYRLQYWYFNDILTG